jgi:hypothetical protein
LEEEHKALAEVDQDLTKEMEAERPNHDKLEKLIEIEVRGWVCVHTHGPHACVVCAHVRGC